MNRGRRNARPWPTSARFMDEPPSMATPPARLQICDERSCRRRQWMGGRPYRPPPSMETQMKKDVVCGISMQIPHSRRRLRIKALPLPRLRGSDFEREGSILKLRSGVSAFAMEKAWVRCCDGVSAIVFAISYAVSLFFLAIVGSTLGAFVGILIGVKSRNNLFYSVVVGAIVGGMFLTNAFRMSISFWLSDDRLFSNILQSTDSTTELNAGELVQQLLYSLTLSRLEQTLAHADNMISEITETETPAQYAFRTSNVKMRRGDCLTVATCFICIASISGFASKDLVLYVEVPFILSLPDLTRASPRTEYRTEARIGEASALGPNPGIENPNYDVVRIIEIRPEAGALDEAEEVRGPGAVEVADAVWDDGEDPGGTAEGLGLRGREAGGEAAGGGSVSVEDLGRRVV
ncbi:hypothetical protein NL676_027662 [Syzygium grande]|nr:hypothetical protein NL676_027662 [Syzygium grande]